MTRTQILIFLAFAYLSVVTAVTWLYGPWGLLGSGVLSLTVTPFIKVKEDQE